MCGFKFSLYAIDNASFSFMRCKIDIHDFRDEGHKMEQIATLGIHRSSNWVCWRKRLVNLIVAALISSLSFGKLGSDWVDFGLLIFKFCNFFGLFHIFIAKRNLNLLNLNYKYT